MAHDDGVGTDLGARRGRSIKLTSSSLRDVRKPLGAPDRCAICAYGSAHLCAFCNAYFCSFCMC